MSTEKRRTKRRYADEIYPHAGEFEVRPLSIEVPYLYAQAIALSTWGTDWFALTGSDDRSTILLAWERLEALIKARDTALLADALLQGMTGDEAWTWAMERAADEEGEIVYDRALHHGVPVETIKPYPVLSEPDHHNHRAASWRWVSRHYVTQVDGKESECPDCTEPVTETQDGE